MNGNIDQLIQFIREHFVFEAAKYPELEGVSEDEHLKFAIRHIALHFAKTAGKITAVSENVDHGEPLNVAQLKLNIAKSLINTLRLAELVHLSEDDLQKMIRELLTSHPKNTTS